MAQNTGEGEKRCKGRSQKLVPFFQIGFLILSSIQIEKIKFNIICLLFIDSQSLQKTN